jgi:putative radical SAM enzyme (TIGR03279 family)
METGFAGKIISVKKHSLAEAAGIVAGESLCAINGITLTDIMDVSFAAADNELNLTVRDTEGVLRNVTVEKEIDEDLGLTFESAVFDRVRLCHNHCIFCFVDRMIPGLRKGLYVRDDDYRLSFLYGNFVTLTNLQEKDFERIIRNHMSPLYVSVHATDPKVRQAMMKNRHSGEIMDKLQRLFDAGIHIHAQIVCCPGWNDGDVLEKSYRDLLAFSEYVEDMAIVPVGITKNKTGLPDLQLFTKEEAATVVKTVSCWQEDCRRRLGRSFVYLGDEFYILAGEKMPPVSWYDGFPQLENGIGLTQNFLAEWEKAKQRHDTSARPSVTDYVIPVGTSAGPLLQPVIEVFNRRYGTANQIVPVINQFFGHSINVTGLLTGIDILTQLPPGRPVILPASVLNHDSLFLDDMPLAEFVRRAGGEVKIARGAEELYSLLLEQPSARKCATGRNSVPERKLTIHGNKTEYVKQFD